MHQKEETKDNQKLLGEKDNLREVVGLVEEVEARFREVVRLEEVVEASLREVIEEATCRRIREISLRANSTGLDEILKIGLT